jgi:hypothetical protein
MSLEFKELGIGLATILHWFDYFPCHESFIGRRKTRPPVLDEVARRLIRK